MHTLGIYSLSAIISKTQPVLCASRHFIAEPPVGRCRILTPLEGWRLVVQTLPICTVGRQGFCSLPAECPGPVESVSRLLLASAVVLLAYHFTVFIYHSVEDQPLLYLCSFNQG